MASSSVYQSVLLSSTIYLISGTYLRFLSLLEERLLSLLLVTLLPSKVLLASNLVNLLRIDTREINLV